MPDPEQLEVLKKGLSHWSQWRSRNPYIKIDLSNADIRGRSFDWWDFTKVDFRGANLYKAVLYGADLREANLQKTNLIGANLNSANLSGTDLSDANLSKANLSEAFLNCANLQKASISGADLSGAFLSGANLSKADLNGSILKDTFLTSASFIAADLSNADISGAYIDHINMSNWIIKGIKCTHVFLNSKRIEYDVKEFEKRYFQIEKIIEMIINLPYSDLTYYIGRIIQEVSVEKYGAGTLVFKGQTAISNTTTRCDFLSFQDNEIIVNINSNLIEIQKKIIDILEERKSNSKDKDIIKLKNKIDLPLVPLQLDTNAIQNVFNERFVMMSPVLQKIIVAVQSVFH